MSNGGRRTRSASKRPPSPQQQKKPPPEKRGPRQKRKSDKRKKRIMVGLALFIGSCVLELIASWTGDIAFMFTTVGPLLAGVVVAVSENLFKPDKDDERPGRDDGFFDRMAMGFRNIVYGIRTNTKLTFLCALIVYLLGCTALAANHAGGRAVNTVKNVLDRLDYEKPAADADDALHTSPVPPDVLEELAPEVPEEYFPQAVSSQYVRLLEPDRILDLSDEERAELYYFAGEYAVGREESAEAVYSAVKTRITALVDEEREDKFDQTEETDKNRGIAKAASDDEEAMETSEDLDHVIENRKIVYADTPGAEIAKLIAENYNGYSLAYYSIGGSKKTMEYYWNESLIWYHNCLTFRGSLTNISGILNRIGMRYHDLAMIQRPGSDEQIRATMLSEAYDALAGSYGAAG